MKHSLALTVTGAKPSSKKEADGAVVYSAIASTPALDRYKEVLLPLGMDYKSFLENPVMPMIHDYHTVPVGKVLDIRVSKESVEFDFVFADSKQGKSVEKLYESGMMNAFSVGLYPKSYKYIDEETPDQLELPVADGKKQKIDLSVYKERPQYIVNQWELLEISPVVVPANPEALLKREAAEFLTKSFGGKGASESGAIGQIFEKRVNTELNKVLHTLKRFESVDVESDLAVVPKHACPTIVDEKWSRSAALVSAAKACSEDGSGDKAKMDWGDFSKWFAWVDVEKADNLSAYEYIHHDFKDGELVAATLGIQTAMSQLLKDKDSESLKMVSDAKGIYDHLAKHYEDAALEIPEFEKTYTDEDLTAIAEGTWKSGTDENDEASGADEDSTVGKDLEVKVSVEVEHVQKAIDEVSAQVKELEQGLNIRLGVQYDILTGLKAKLEELTIISSNELVPESLPLVDEDEDLSKAFATFMTDLEESVAQ